MADQFWYLKTYDRYPSITRQLTDSAGAAIDLTGCSVLFIMKLPAASTPKVSAAATIVTAATGQVRYDWAAADVDTAGRYRQEWQVTFGDGRKMTIPNASYDWVIVTSDLNGA